MNYERGPISTHESILQPRKHSGRYHQAIRQNNALRHAPHIFHGAHPRPWSRQNPVGISDDQGPAAPLVEEPSQPDLLARSGIHLYSYPPQRASVPLFHGFWSKPYFPGLRIPAGLSASLIRWSTRLLAPSSRRM